MQAQTNYSILKPIITPPVAKDQVQILTEVSTAIEMYSHLTKLKGLTAVDIETNGTNAADPNTKIVGIGFATKEICFYVDRAGCSDAAWCYLLSHLNSGKLDLIGHNVFFDAAFLTRDSGEFYNWIGCTYGLYRQLANEGWPGQKWSLKTAQLELLGWKETNEWELDRWLIQNGHYKGPIKENHRMRERYEAWNEGKIRPIKGEMHRAPSDILGYYCGVDCISTLLLYTKVIRPAMEALGPAALKNVEDYHRCFIDNVRIHIEQQLRGIEVDSAQLAKHRDHLEVEIDASKKEFFSHPDVTSAIKAWNQMKVEEHQAKEPAQFKKKKVSKEPPMYKKNGEVSLNWIKWNERAEAPLETSKNWINWKERMKEVEETNHFNLNSGPQKQWLFYDRLGHEVLLRTDSGLPATDHRALNGFGEVGKILKKNNDSTKELGYVEGCLSHLSDGKIHPQFRMPGTLTGRLAGSGGINIQQLPKSKGYLDCWIPRDGWVWVDCDHTSLEQVVLAELSRDKTLWTLYGPEAGVNDVYLFNGSHLPGISTDIISAGYNPNSPTEEGIARAKRQAKKARNISKVITLGSSYGMGPNKIQMTLKLQGIDVSKDEAYRLWRSYWDLYGGVKDYQKYLEGHWAANDGWVFNGIGRPVAVCEAYKKDIVNRVVQSTGHDVHMMWVSILFKLFKDKGLEVHPIIADFHDQSIVECRPDVAEEVKLTFLEAYDILNEEQLKGAIPITGDAQVVHNLSQAKLE